MDDEIKRFLEADVFAVAGASQNRDKYGNKVLRCYMQKGRRVIPVNPRQGSIEGLSSVASVRELPPEVKSLSIITAPAVTEIIVAEAISQGIENIWMQPGAQSEKAIEMCRLAGVNVIADGSCLLVVLGSLEG